jgi:GAF domain-containing protein
MSRPLPQTEASQLPGVATPLPSPADKLDRILQNLVRRALHETRASSAAIGVMQENAMVCRAAAGLPLAHVGAPIDIESGLTAMAVRREMSQWCSDTESDARVDAEVCERLGVRSIIVVPVRSAQSVTGVFAVFATTPDAFSLDNLNTIKKLAHWTGEAIENAVSAASAQTITPVVAKSESPETQPRFSLYSETTFGMKIRNFVAKIWPALAPASPRRHNERLG